MAIKTTQATLYMKTRRDGQCQATAAARAGFSERSGRRIDAREHCSQRPPSPRNYSTRTDPLAEVWDNELEPMLQRQPRLLPITLFEY